MAADRAEAGWAAYSPQVRAPSVSSLTSSSVTSSPGRSVSTRPAAAAVGSCSMAPPHPRSGAGVAGSFTTARGRRGDRCWVGSRPGSDHRRTAGLERGRQLREHRRTRERGGIVAGAGSSALSAVPTGGACRARTASRCGSDAGRRRPGTGRSGPRPAPPAAAPAPAAPSSLQPAHPRPH